MPSPSSLQLDQNLTFTAIISHSKVLNNIQARIRIDETEVLFLCLKNDIMKYQQLIMVIGLIKLLRGVRILHQNSRDTAYLFYNVK